MNLYARTLRPLGCAHLNGLCAEWCADLVNVVRRMKLLGFNAVRIPFSFKDLYKEKPLNFKIANCPTPTLSTMLAGITDPAWADRGVPPTSQIHLVVSEGRF